MRGAGAAPRRGGGQGTVPGHELKQLRVSGKWAGGTKTDLEVRLPRLWWEKTASAREGPSLGEVGFSQSGKARKYSKKEEDTRMTVRTDVQRTQSECQARSPRDRLTRYPSSLFHVQKYPLKLHSHPGFRRRGLRGRNDAELRDWGAGHGWASCSDPCPGAGTQNVEEGRTADPRRGGGVTWWAGFGPVSGAPS